MRCTVLFVLGLVSVAACRPSSPTFGPEQRAATADSLRLLAQSVADAWNRGDDAVYIDYHVADSTFTLAAMGSIIRGRDSFADFVHAGRAEQAASRVVFEGMHIDVIAPDVGVVTAGLTWDATDSAGVRSVVHGTYTMLIVRTPAGWKIMNAAETFPS